MKLVSLMVHSPPFSKNAGNVFSTPHSLPPLLWARRPNRAETSSLRTWSMKTATDSSALHACWVGVSELPAQVPKTHWLWLELVHSNLEACPSLCTLNGWEMFQRAWNPTMSLVAWSKVTSTMAKSAKPDMSDQYGFQLQHRTLIYRGPQNVSWKPWIESNTVSLYNSGRLSLLTTHAQNL